MRPFRLASVGGTFNWFHQGHRGYLKIAFILADQVHIMLASDSFARQRKLYEPRPWTVRIRYLEAFLEDAEFTQRHEIALLNELHDIEDYAVTCDLLDLVVVERAYFDWFDEWNRKRVANHRPSYHILCKPRTLLHGRDISSSEWTSDLQITERDPDAS
jgi:pantetheine-phosphate adenylyltransferase